ncbi:MAG: extra-cytoplasmic solute receptor BugT, partial [Betaproteobacteria bacterium]|nr:extra-cytoplasmic solute receptor BugT [Betaproteobacteria bacterium]
MSCTLNKRCVASIFALGLAGFTASPAFAQSYPTRPIRIVTSPAGGGNDFPARLLSRALAAPLGQPLIVDNRATVLIADLVAKAPPDGHTLLVTGSAHWIGPLLEKTSYDPLRD